MLRTNYRCVQSPNISVDVAKCGENFHKFTLYTHFYLLQKMTCLVQGEFVKVSSQHLTDVSVYCYIRTSVDWTILFMVFQLIRMSSYAKNKLQMCSVTQNQCRRRQMWGNFHKFTQVHSLFVWYKKWLVLTEQSIHGNVSTHEDVLLC